MDLLGRDTFEYSGEFYFMMHVAKELERRGGSLDLTGMALDWSSVNDEYKFLFNSLQARGGILAGGQVPVSGDAEGVSDVDVAFFGDVELFGKDHAEGREILLWSTSYAQQYYGEEGVHFGGAKRLRYYLFQLVAFHFIESLVSGNPQTLEIILSPTETKNFYLYDDLLLINETLGLFRGLMHLELTDAENVEVDLYLHAHMAQQKGTYKSWTLPEKLEQLKQLGVQEGSILHLWERKGVRRGSKVGEIPGVFLVRVDKIGDTQIQFSKLGATKSVEELRLEWASIDEDVRNKFGSYTDVLNRAPVIESVSILSLGVDMYFYDENYLLTPLDYNEEVEKPLTHEGEIVRATLSARKMFYIMLNQWKIPFDRELYVATYLSEESKSPHFSLNVTTAF